MKRLSIFLFSISLTLFFTACSSKPKVNWESRVGHYTYSQAVAELGVPDRTTEVDNKKKVAEWNEVRRSSSVGFGVGTGFYGSGSAVGVGSSISPGPDIRALQLTFDQNDILKSWSRVRR